MVSGVSLELGFKGSFCQCLNVVFFCYMIVKWKDLEEEFSKIIIKEVKDS